MRFALKSIRRTGSGFAIAFLLASASLGQEGREIARTTFPSVVLIVADKGKGHRGSLGSGFFVQDDLIVTNYHVVRGFSRIQVKLTGHKEIYQAKVLTVSSAKDLAFLRVVGAQATPLSFGDAQEVAVGDKVYAIGNPEGWEATFSDGVVSGIRQFGGNRYFQISAPISHGSSGGPVLNKSGEVIGVAVGTLPSGQNLNFAIPISEVAALMNQTAEKREDADAAGPLTGIAGGLPKTARGESKLPDYANEKIKKAIDLVRKQPDSVTAHFNLAQTYREIEFYGVTEKAIEEYKRVIRMKPDYAAAYYGLARCYESKSHFAGVDHLSFRRLNETAITYYKQAIRIDPDYVEAHVGLGDAFNQLDRVDEAIAAIRLAIRINPTFANAYKSLGYVFYSVGRYDEAIEAHKTAASLETETYLAAFDYRVIGDIYQETERYDQAITNYQQAIRLSEADHIAYYGLIDCYAKSGRLEDGIAYFKNLVVKMDDKPPKNGGEIQKSVVAHYALGMMYAYSGDTKAALEQYKFLKSQGTGKLVTELAEQLFGQIYK